MLLKLILILVLAGILAGLAAQQHLLERSHVASGIRKKIQIFDGIAVLIFIVRFMPLPLGSTQFVQALALGMLVFLAVSTLLLLLFQLRPTGTRTVLLAESQRPAERRNQRHRMAAGAYACRSRYPAHAELPVST